MRIFLAILIACLIVPSVAICGFEGPGITSHSQRHVSESGRHFKPVKVSQLKGLHDDARVILEGRISSKTGDERYSFTDGTGQIEVEIDDDLIYNVKITPETRIRIFGEVDRDHNSTKVEADWVELAK